MKKITLLVLLFCYLTVTPKESNCSIYYTLVKEQNASYIFELAITHLKQYEGFISTPYKCPAGQWTIGYGHAMRGSDRYDTITEESAAALLRDDLYKYISYVEDDLGILFVDEPNKIVLMALLAFNTGIGNWSRSTLRKKVIAGEEFEEEFLKWHFVNKKASKNLINRRNDEIKLYKHLV